MSANYPEQLHRNMSPILVTLHWYQICFNLFIFSDYFRSILTACFCLCCIFLSAIHPTSSPKVFCPIRDPEVQGSVKTLKQSANEIW